MSFKVTVGVTTDPKSIRSFYQNQIKGFCNWQILETFTCREDALECAIMYAENYEFELDSEITEPGPIFYVYRLEYME